MSRSILVSACLMGDNCRFDGRNRLRSELPGLLKDDQLIPVCPEVEGGLSIPRPPAEIRGNRVYRENGEDITAQFKQGAEICLEKGRSQAADLAVLKSRSPACGCGHIYDGTFSGTLVKGDGIFTQILKNANIKCISDEDFIASQKEIP